VTPAKKIAPRIQPSRLEESRGDMDAFGGNGTRRGQNNKRKNQVSH